MPIKTNLQGSAYPVFIKERRSSRYPLPTTVITDNIFKHLHSVKFRRYVADSTAGPPPAAASLAASPPTSSLAVPDPNLRSAKKVRQRIRIIFFLE